MHVDAEQGSVFGFRPNLEKNPNTGASNAVASHSGEDGEPYVMGFVVIFFIHFFYLTL